MNKTEKIYFFEFLNIKIKRSKSDRPKGEKIIGNNLEIKYVILNKC